MSSSPSSGKKYPTCLLLNHKRDARCHPEGRRNGYSRCVSMHQAVSRTRLLRHSSKRRSLVLCFCKRFEMYSKPLGVSPRSLLVLLLTLMCTTSILGSFRMAQSRSSPIILYGAIGKNCLQSFKRVAFADVPLLVQFWFCN